MVWERFSKAVGGALFEDGDAPTPAPAAQPAGGPQTAQRPAQAAFVPQAPGLNQEMVDTIRAQTFSRNTALTALIKASDELKDFIPDPVMRLKAAYKTAGGGRRPTDIADAVAIHLNDVNAAETAFGAALDQARRNEVTSLISQADNVEATLRAKHDEIQRMTARIAQLQQEQQDQEHTAHNLRAEAAQKEAEFSNSAAEFKAAADHVRSELTTHKTTILSTLT